MQLVLGVAVTDSVARLALVDASSPASVLDRFDIDISSGATQNLVRTITDTNKALSADGTPLTATTICWSDDAQATTLRTALAGAGVGNVTVVSVRDAATAFVRSTAGSSGEHTSALLLVDDASAALSVVGPDAANTSLIDIESMNSAEPDAACNVMLERLREETGGAQTLYVLSSSGDSAALTDRLRSGSPIPMHAAAEPAYLLARGAAATAAGAAAAQSFTAPSPVIGEHLAYSMADDSGSMPFGMAGGYEPMDAPSQMPMPPLSGANAAAPADLSAMEGPPAAAGRPRVLLLGSTIAAIVVVGFAVLAVGVAIGIKPVVSQQAVRDPEAVPGKYLPPMPGQGVERVEDPQAYMPPVVPVAAVAPEPGSAAVSQAGGGGGYSGNYNQASGSIPGGGPAVVIGGDPAPAAVPGNPVGGNPLGGFRLSDWLPKLPENLTINLGKLPNGTSPCDPKNPACFIHVFGCAPKRPGTIKCLEDQGYITPQSEIEKSPPPCPTDALSTCVFPQPLDHDKGNPPANPDEPAPDPAETPKDSNKSPHSGPSGSGEQSDSVDGPKVEAPEGDTPKPVTDQAPADAGMTSTPVTTTSKATETTSTPVTTTKTSESAKNTSTTETTSPTSTRTTTSAAAPEPAQQAPRAPEPEPKSAPEPKVAPAPAPAPKPEPEPAPAPKPAPPVVQAPPPVVEAPAPPAPKPAPPVVQAPPPVVEAPAPEPAPLVVTPEPASPPSSSSESGSGSGTDSRKSKSSSSPTTSVTSSP